MLQEHKLDKQIISDFGVTVVKSFHKHFRLFPKFANEIPI